MMPAPRSRLLRRSIIPSAVSIALHGLLLLLILGVTIDRLTPAKDTGPTLLELDAEPAPGTPPAAPPPPARPGPSAASPASAPASAPSPDPAVTEAARTAAAEALAGGGVTPPEFAASITPPPPIAAAAPTAPAAAFAGLHARAATRIVYAVDTSGSMVHTLSFVLDELARSISRLQPTQSFQVVLFAEKPGAPPVRMPPVGPGRGGLIRATPANRLAVVEWLHTVIAGGRSNPVEGLRAAIGLEPDLIFVLARSIQRTGVDADAAGRVERVLARLDALNPVDPKTGRRPTVIKTIQFIDEDPTGLMQRIARAHGDGAGSYRLLTPEALGDDPPPTINAEPLPESAERAIADAGRALASVDRTLASVAVLSGVATEAETRAVADAARSALETLADAPPATTRTADWRAQLLRGRAALLAAALETNDARRRDLARRAIADTAPLPIVDPGADAVRGITLALARSLTGAARRAHDDLLAMIRNRNDAGLDTAIVAMARLALLTAADRIGPRSPEAQRDRDALAGTITADRRGDAVWPDPAWRALAGAALAHSFIRAGSPVDVALAPLRVQLHDRSLPDEHKRALLYPRLALVARGLPDPPPDALGAMAEYAAWTGRVDEAVPLFLRLADADPGARAEATRSAAVLLDRRGGPGDAARARALLIRYASENPADAENALTLALSRPGAGPEQLRAAIEIAPDHPLADRWRFELASIERGDAGLAVLDGVRAPTDRTRALQLELIDELLAGPRAGDRDLLLRAAALTERVGAAMTDTRRVMLAGALLESDPTRALEALDPIGPGSPEADRADLIRLRARLALGWEAEAFETARDLAARREPVADAVFWEAATVWLELGAARGGREARAAAAAHVARLRLAHPDLGGEPWAARINAVANKE